MEIASDPAPGPHASLDILHLPRLSIHLLGSEGFNRRVDFKTRSFAFRPVALANLHLLFRYTVHVAEASEFTPQGPRPADEPVESKSNHDGVSFSVSCYTEPDRKIDRGLLYYMWKSVLIIYGAPDRHR